MAKSPGTGRFCVQMLDTLGGCFDNLILEAKWIQIAVLQGKWEWYDDTPWHGWDLGPIFEPKSRHRSPKISPPIGFTWWLMWLLSSDRFEGSGQLTHRWLHNFTTACPQWRAWLRSDSPWTVLVRWTWWPCRRRISRWKSALGSSWGQWISCLKMWYTTVYHPQNVGFRMADFVVPFCWDHANKAALFPPGFIFRKPCMPL